MTNSPFLSPYFIVRCELRTEKDVLEICRGFFHEKYTSTYAKQARQTVKHTDGLHGNGREVPAILLRGLSPQGNYTDRAAAAGRRS